LASDGLKGRVFSVSLADLNKDEDRAYRIMKFVVEDVQGSFLSLSGCAFSYGPGKNCLTNFQGMTFTSDKVKGLIKKWQSLIEANVEVKTVRLLLFFLSFFSEFIPRPMVTLFDCSPLDLPRSDLTKLSSPPMPNRLKLRELERYYRCPFLTFRLNLNFRKWLIL
jgi:hypothetical protein